jgi:hypothetical protein
MSLLAAVDDLYSSVVVDPEVWTDQALADWVEDAASDGVTREEATALRRCLRAAEKLRAFWAEGRAQIPADEWEARVDIALGVRAWRPALELAMAGLDRSPSPELFAEVGRRFRVVNGTPWLESVTYDAWIDGV